jgi:hypothetical protein
MGSDPALYPVVRFMSASRLCLTLSAVVFALVQPAAAALMVQPSVDPARFSAIHPHPLVPSSWDSSPMAVVGESQMWDPTGEACVDGGSWDDPFPGGKGDMRAPAFCVARPCLRMLSPDELARDVFGRPLEPGDWPVYLSRYRNSCLSSDPDAPVMVASAKDFADLLGLPAATPAAVLLASGTGWVAPPVQGWTVVTAAAPANPRNTAQGPWPAPGAGLSNFLSAIGSSGGGGSGPAVPILTAASGSPAGSGPLPGGGSGGSSGGGSAGGGSGGSGDDGSGGGSNGGGGGSGGGNGGSTGGGGSGSGGGSGGSGGSGGNGGGSGGSTGGGGSGGGSGGGGSGGTGGTGGGGSSGGGGSGGGNGGSGSGGGSGGGSTGGGGSGGGPGGGGSGGTGGTGGGGSGGGGGTGGGSGGSGGGSGGGGPNGGNGPGGGGGNGPGGGGGGGGSLDPDDLPSVPVPPALPLLAAGLATLGLSALRRSRRKA